MNISTDFKPVLTKAALALQNKNAVTEFKALVFQEPVSSSLQPQNRRHKGDDQQEKEESSKHSVVSIGKIGTHELEFDIKTARHEVLNFAMSNQRTIKNQKKMQIFQAIKLGAKPQKKPYKNYKELLAERKRLKDIREDRKKFHQLGKNQTGAASVKCRSKTKLDKQHKVRAPVSSIDKHYGVVKPNLRKRK